MFKHVLVVEDDWSTRELLLRFLKFEGYAVVSVGDGQTAWGLLDQGKKFDLIISSNDIPKMSGIELLRRMRADSRTAKVPFALASGAVTVSRDDPTSLESLCAELGAIFYPKPCNFDTLIAQLLDNNVPAAGS